MKGIDGGELYSQRLLVFIETEPQSNQYHQIILGGNEFKKVSDSIGTVIKNGIFQKVELKESEETYTLPDLKEIYE